MIPFSRLVVAQEMEGGNREWLLMGRGSLLGVMKMF